jgi:hypothetical protein
MAKNEEVTLRQAGSNVTTHTSLDLSSFTLENCTFEVRYPNAFAFWDKAGQLWLTVQEKWPDMSVVFADARKTDFKTGKTRLTVELDQARIGASDPSVEEIFKEAREFIRLTTKELQITTYKRVGFRSIYFKEFKDKKEAAEAFFSLKLLRLPEGKKFEIDDTPISAQYLLRWESEKKGVMVHLRSETRVVDVEPSPEAERFMKPIHRETSGIVFDCDYYTVAPVEPGQLDPLEWMKHAMHIIARDSGYIFGE